MKLLDSLYSSDSSVGGRECSPGDVATNMFTATFIRDMSKSEKSRVANG